MMYLTFFYIVTKKNILKALLININAVYLHKNLIVNAVP